MSKNITKGGVEVRPGQVWKDLDWRMGDRHCRVLSVAEGYARMQCCNSTGYILMERVTKVAVRRMHRHSTGWALVSK